MRLIQQALTFDDVLLVPAHSTILPREVNLTTQLTKKIKLHIPIVSAAMDTVTESRLAIALAQEGGLGIIHKNMTPQEQAYQVSRVKRFESGVVNDPITINPNMSVRDVMNLTALHKISGLPVIDGGKIVGIVTNRDLRFETNLDQPIKNIMTPRDRLVTVKEGESKDEVIRLLHHHRLERVLVVDKNDALKGLITVKDIQKSSDHPYACKDDKGRLCAGAAVGVGEGTEERVELLANAHVDVIVVDTAHGHSQGVLDRVRWVKKHFPQVQVVGGNICTGEAALALLDSGADAVKVGIGPGSICTTRVVAGVGVPQLAAVMSCAEEADKQGVPVIADGGIKFSGDMAKALAGGAPVEMQGTLTPGSANAVAVVPEPATLALFGPALGIASVVPDTDVTKPGTLTARALADAVAAIDATLEAELAPEARRLALQLPPGLNPRTVDLGRQWSAESGGDDENGKVTCVHKLRLRLSGSRATAISRSPPLGNARSRPASRPMKWSKCSSKWPLSAI